MSDKDWLTALKQMGAPEARIRAAQRYNEMRSSNNLGHDTIITFDEGILPFVSGDHLATYLASSLKQMKLRPEMHFGSTASEQKTAIEGELEQIETILETLKARLKFGDAVAANALHEARTLDNYLNDFYSSLISNTDANRA